jgi:hypothetical protein
MTKARHPQAIKRESAQALASKLEDLTGSLENWFQSRQDRLQSQIKLIQSCRSDAEIQRYKDQGLLDFGNENILSDITKSQ